MTNYRNSPSLANLRIRVSRKAHIPLSDFKNSRYENVTVAYLLKANGGARKIAVASERL
jgi:hypothetical protein